MNNYQREYIKIFTRGSIGGSNGEPERFEEEDEKPEYITDEDLHIDV